MRFGQYLLGYFIGTVLLALVGLPQFLITFPIAALVAWWFYAKDRRQKELDNLPLDHRAPWEKPQHLKTSPESQSPGAPQPTASHPVEPDQPRFDLVPCPRCAERHVVEAILLEARQLIAYWGEQAPERIKKEAGLAGDLARIDAAIAKAGIRINTRP